MRALLTSLRDPKLILKTCNLGRTCTTMLVHSEVESDSKKKHDIKDAHYVFFDLETTGLSRTSDITQIGATCSDGSTFSCYSLPTQPIHPTASEVTGLTVANGSLYLKGEPIDSVPIEKCLTEFLQFLEDKKKPLCLGHNIRSFDCPVLFHQLTICSLMDRFDKSICGFVDTLPLFQKAFPEERRHSLSALLENIMELKFDAHNAVDDTQATKLLFDYTGISGDSLGEQVFSIEDVVMFLEVSSQRKKNEASFWPLIHSHAMSKYMATKFSKHSIGREDLVVLYRQSGEDAVKKLLSEEVDGKPRITSSSIVIKRIIKYLELKSSK